MPRNNSHSISGCFNTGGDRFRNRGELSHLLRKDGSRVQDFSSHALISTGNRPDEFFCLDIDLSEQKRVESELREGQELFRLFMKYTPVYTFIKEIDGEQVRVILISDNYTDMLGRPAAEMIGRTMDELFPADLADKITRDDLRIFHAGVFDQIEEVLNGRLYDHQVSHPTP